MKDKPRTTKQIKTDDLLAKANGHPWEHHMLTDIVADVNSRRLYDVLAIVRRIESID